VTQKHGSSGEILNLNDSRTCFTAAAVQISKITSKITRHAKHTLCWTLNMFCVRPKIWCRILSSVSCRQKYTNSSDYAAKKSQKSIIMKTSCLDYSILPKANGLKNFSPLNHVPRSTQWTVYWGKTFHRVFKAVDRDRIKSRLIYHNKIYFTTLFSIDKQWNAPPLNWWNCLLDI